MNEDEELTKLFPSLTPEERKEVADRLKQYLELAYDERKRSGQMRNMHDLRSAIEDGAVKRLRPKVMTVAVMFLGLVRIM